MNFFVRIITLSTFLLLCLGGSAQQLSLGKTPYANVKSAVLELNADNQGLLLSRLPDTAAINTLNPPDGMVIYFVPTRQLMIRTGGFWSPIAASALLKNYWSLGGNANAGAQKLGNTDNYDLPIITNNIERMRIAASGSVGIGTSAPAAMLHVAGTNPLFLQGVQTGSNTTSDSLLLISSGVVQKLPAGTFQNKLTGSGFVKASGGVISYDNNNYTVANAAILAATKTKITFDSKGLVTGGADATTADIAEGSNLYFTEARVRNTPLTGLSLASATAVAATDNVLNGIGKLQGQINTINGAGYLTANQNITLSGDISGSGTTAITTAIGSNKVTLSHLAQVSTGTFLGRTTTGLGNVEALTTAQAKTLLGLAGTNSGDVTLAGQSYLSLAGQALTAGAIDLSGSHVSGTLAAARFGALSGDVTSTAGSYATTIAAGAVTYGKMQNVSATNRLLGRASAGAGITEEITIGTGLSLSGTTLSANGAGMWSTGGNSNGVLSKLGTNDNYDLPLYTNNVERMRILATGNVGVGTTTPTEKLEVAGNIKINGGNKRLIFGNMGSDPDATIGLRATGATEQQELLFYIGNDNNNGFGPDRIRMAAEEFRFQTFNNDAANTQANAESGTSLNTRMLISSNGTVGINTISPNTATKLDVNGSVKLGTTGTALNNLINFEYSTSGNLSIGANSTTDVLITLPSGTTINSTVRAAISVSPGTDLASGLIIGYARAISTTQIKLRLCNTNSMISASVMNNTKFHFSIVDF